MDDTYNLKRFLDAQNNIYENVINELYKGYKIGHWMWFIFPQVKGLGHTSTSIFFSISSKAEAINYFEHPILGKRLIECARIVTNITGRTSKDIFGPIDDLKFRSSMTLFNLTQNETRVFKDALDKYYNAKPDSLTIDFLKHK